MRLHRGLPLRPTLVTGVMALIILAAGTTGVSAYLSSSRAIRSLWKSLSTELVDGITEKTLRYLEPAVPYVEMTEHLADEGRINPDDRLALLDYFRAAIHANPNFTWASYGDETGAYLAAYRTPDGEVHGTWREQIPAEGGKPVTLWRDFREVEDRWRPYREKKEFYDPRTRDWYKHAAAKADGGVWGEPFLFTSRRQPGFIYSRRYVREGKVQGVWAVQYEVNYLSRFLKTLALGETGRVYVVSRSGLVVAHPEGRVLSDDKSRILRVDEHPDAMLRDAWAKWDGAGRRFRIGTMLGLAEPFPAESGIDWVVMGVVPEDEFFGEARRQAIIAVVFSAACLLLAVFFGAFLANRVSSALREMSEEMDRIGHFELSEQKLAAQKSIVREVNVMGQAADRMKSSLRSFARYVPTELVKELMSSGDEAKLGGQKKELTILFCDIAGFTTLSEQVEPEMLVSSLADYFAAMSDAVAAQGGTVDKYIGDAVMAFWGAPHAVDEPALRACRAALKMMERIREMAARWEAQGKPRIDVRIGINSGLAIVGNIGSHARMNYTVMGDTVNLASRLEGLNKVYGTRILLGEATAAQVKDRMILRPLDFVAVKGKARANMVHELLGEPSSANGHVARAADLHRQALELYRGRSFEQAAARFDEVAAALGGDDAASRILAERCRRFLADPPPQQWDGSMAMKEK